MKNKGLFRGDKKRKNPHPRKQKSTSTLNEEEAACECGAEEQTADRVIATNPTYCYPNWIQDQEKANESRLVWLTETCPAI